MHEISSIVGRRIQAGSSATKSRTGRQLGDVPSSNQLSSLDALHSMTECAHGESKCIQRQQS